MIVPNHLTLVQDEPKEKQRPQPMTESEVLKAVDQEIRWASDILVNDLSGNRAQAWKYFKGEAPGLKDEDISDDLQTIVSRDVENAIESTLAEILPAFATDRPAQFDALGPGDEEAAAMESDICNDILMEAGSGYLELTTAAKNALLLRIGALEVIWEDKRDVTYHEVPNASLIQIAVWYQQPNLEVMPTEELDAEQIMRAAQTGTLSVTVKETTRQQKCIVDAVPPDELLISSDCTSLDLDKARFVGRMTPVSRSDLIAEGYDPAVIDRLTPYTTTTSQHSRTARERNSWGRDKWAGDRGMDLIMMVRCYYRLDEDRDGIAERRRILVGGAPGGWTLLDDSPISYQPFAAGAAYIWPHMPYGVSLYDKLKHVQDLKSKYWRIMLEGGARAARDNLVAGPGVDFDDVQVTEFGHVVRAPDPSKLQAVPNNHFPAEISALQEISDKARREGGGGAIDKSSAENMPVEAGAHGVERMLSAIEELNSMVARMLAETLVQQAYRKIHLILRLYSPPIPQTINGEHVLVDPQQWPHRDKTSVSTGLTLSERGRLAQALGFLAQKQTEAIQNGSVIANEQTLYRTLQDQARLLGIQNPESYLIDPSSEEGQQAAQQREEQQQQQQQQQERLAMLQYRSGMAVVQAQRENTDKRFMLDSAKLQQKTQSEAAKLAEDARQANQDASLKATELEIESSQDVPGSRV